MMKMSLRRLMRYEELKSEVRASELLDLSEVMMYPVASPVDRQKKRLEWMRTAHIVPPSPPRIAKKDIKKFLAGAL